MQRKLGLWPAILLAGLTIAQVPAIAQGTQFSAWWWSDKYVYLPGEAVTIRISSKQNGDNTPYTAFFYRQNNQTGKKTYISPAGYTDAPIDFLGRTAAQGYAVVGAGTVTKFVMMGDGGYLPKIAIPPNEPLGMQTIVGEWRDATGTRVLKALYMKISVVSEVVQVNAPIITNTTWVRTKSYRLNGLIFVKSGATLTIESGTIVTGAPGSQPPSALIVTTDGKIRAIGTRSRPIIMTSDQPFGRRTRGDWGGLALLGKARLNVPANAAGQPTSQGTFYLEGITSTVETLFGGQDDEHDCGTLQYVRSEYAGSILRANTELNSFTFAGCGSNTVADHLQAIYGLDDSFEWFGGSMDAKYLVGGLGADDYVDWQLGWRGRLQYGVFYQSPNVPSNKGIEADNSEYVRTADPRSDPVIYNMTFLGSGVPGWDENPAPGIHFRRATRGTINDILVAGFYSAAISILEPDTVAELDAGNIHSNGIVMWNNNISGSGAATLEGQITDAATLAYAQGTRGGGTGENYLVANPLLTRPAELSDPDFRPMTGSALLRTGWVSPPDDGFFDQSANFVGGMGAENWMEEWTSFLVETDIAP